MNAILAIFLFAASFMAGFPAAVGFPQVTAVAPNSLAATIGIESDDILLGWGSRPFHVSAVPDLEYDVTPKDLPDISENASLTVSRDGAIIAFPLPAGTEMQGLLEDVSYTPVLVTEIMLTAEDSPAAHAGLLPGDLVYSVDDSAITLGYPLNEAVQKVAGGEVSMTVLRDQEWVGVNVTPRLDPPEGQGALGVQISHLSALATLPPIQAAWQGVLSTGEYIVLVLRLPVMLMVGQMSPSDAQLSGPVGIAQLIGGAVSATIETGLWFPIFRLAAVLSAALAITNMLPLPALDGGRLLFILFETMRGRRVNPEREGMIHMVGFMLLLGLLVLITVRDITTVQQGIDWVTLLGQ
jgi:regulator of sigma E protease